MKLDKTWHAVDFTFYQRKISFNASYCPDGDQFPVASLFICSFLQREAVCERVCIMYVSVMISQMFVKLNNRGGLPQRSLSLASLFLGLSLGGKLYLVFALQVSWASNTWEQRAGLSSHSDLLS